MHFLTGLQSFTFIFSIALYDYDSAAQMFSFLFILSISIIVTPESSRHSEVVTTISNNMNNIQQICFLITILTQHPYESCFILAKGEFTNRF